MLRESLGSVDIFLSISKNIKKDLLNLNINLKKIHNIPNCINFKKFQKYKIKKKKELKFITVGRYAQKKKGYDKIDKIARLLINRKIKFKWILIGKNINQLREKKIINRYKSKFYLIDNIENIHEKYFPNSKLIKLYKSADLYLNLSRVESFGITFIEALASGLPIVSFNTKGANEIVINNYNGIIIKNHKIETYVKELSQLLQNKVVLSKLRSNTLKSVKKYDLDIVVNKILKIFKKI